MDVVFKKSLGVERQDYLTTHQLDQHVEGGRLQVSTWGVGEVFQDVLQSFRLRAANSTSKLYLEGACCSEEVVHSILESLSSASVVPRPHL